MADAPPTAAALREHVADLLRGTGIDVVETDSRLAVRVGDLECDIVVSRYRITPGSGRVNLALAGSEGDATRIHVAVFVDAISGMPTGSALVVSEDTLADTVGGAGDSWIINVAATATDNPTGPLDVCVTPLVELGEWVCAELADWADEE